MIERATSGRPPADAVLHLTLEGQWQDALEAGEHRLSTRTATLEEVGLIHCSFPSQIERTANFHYGDVDEVLVLHIDVEKCPDAELRVEDAAGEFAGQFPHLYGPLPVEAVVALWRWRRSGEGFSVEDLWGDPGR